MPTPGDAARTRRWIAGAALAGVILRLAFGFGYWVHQPLTRDEREYLSLARGLASGRGFVYDADVLDGPLQPFGRAPGYPAFLALVGGGASVATSVPGRVKAAQAVAGGIGIVLAALIAGQLAGSAAARVTAAAAALYPPLVWIAGYAFSEALFWPIGLLIAWLWNGFAARRSLSRSHAAALGALAGAAMLVRPMMLFFVPVAALWLARRRAGTAAIVFAASAAAVVAPWALRSSFTHARFVPLASEGGITFWTGNHPLARGEGDLAANPALKQASQALHAAHPELTEEQMEPVYYRDAFAWIAHHPIDWLWLEARKAFYFVVPVGPSYTLHSRRYMVASIVSYALALALAIAAIWRLGSSLERAPGLWLLVATSIVASLVFFPQERFRLPIVDPALVILAGVALTRRLEVPA